MDRRGAAAVSFAVSAAICLGVLLSFLDEGAFYADVEKYMHKEVVSAYAENQESPSALERALYDESMWGKLARVIEKGISSWLG